MDSIFKLHDVVFTPEINDGSLTVGGLASNGVYAGKATDPKGNHSRWYPNCFLSFIPWPEPVHVRPLRDGLYVVKSVGTNDYVRRKIRGQWYETAWGEATRLATSPSPGLLIYVGE